jgi:anti-sigma regulatory factor (Ser/Thr protein kinase)
MVTLRPPRQLLFEVEPDVRALGHFRDGLRGFLADTGVEPEAAEDLLLVASELCTNAIEATPDGTPVHVEIRFDGRSLRLSVANVAGEAARPAAELRHGSLQSRGRGLGIVQSLVDTLAISTSEGRTVVRTVQLLEDPGGGPGSG